MFDRHVAFAAGQMPGAIAVSDGRDHWSFRDLDRVTSGAAALLAAEMDRRGIAGRAETVVAIAAADPFRHTLIALACARIGVASASVFPAMAQPMTAMAGAMMLVSDQPREGALLADGDFFAQAAASDVRLPRLRLDERAIGRVQFSSGSTGSPKAVAISWGAYEARIGGGLFGAGQGMRRVLSLIGPESGSLQLALTTWKHRGCVLFGPAGPAALAAALPVLDPTGLLASPAQLGAVLDALPPGFTPAAGLEVAVGGGSLPAALADRAARRLGARITTVYASTEAGTTAIGFAATLTGQGAAGHVTASSTVVIVDDAGQEVADGVAGRVRIASAEMARGYCGEDGAGAFADGWFTPGDLGVRELDGTLRIIGRIDEVMNFGGEKFLPGDLEEQVRAVAGVVDVAAFALDGDDGQSQPWLAVVRDAGASLTEREIGAALTIRGLPPVHIVWADTIPRSAMGKVQRETLRDATRRMRAARR